MNDGVRNFLDSLGMLKYYDIFCAKGFDLESDIPHLSLSDLKESLMIDSCKDRNIIFAHAQKFRPSAEHALFEWLHRHSLDHYFINFIQSELIDLNILANVELPNEDLYDELEIVLPGHKKRLERAVASLRQEGCGNQPAETPVTQGWWGKPDCLPQAKFEFLCVRAKLFGLQDPENKASIDFMVDSGSDVSTVQEKTLAGLNLQLIGPIYSCGIHGGNYTNLYKAFLEVGDEQLPIEVMASNYDSLGSRIVRHFRHVIDGNRHIWLKGNYKDPLPAILPLATSVKSSEKEGVKSLPSSIPLPLLPSSPASLSSSLQTVISSPGKNNIVSQNENTPSCHLELELQSHSKSTECKPQIKEIKETKSHVSLLQNELKSNSKEMPCSNGFIPLSSLPANKSSQIRVHPHPATDNLFDDDNSQTSSQNIFDNSVSVQNCYRSKDKNQEKDVSLNDGVQEQISRHTSLLEAEEHHGEPMQDDEQNTNSKSSDRKRHNPVLLNKLATPRKRCKKAQQGDIILSVLKDTDDDIDNVNPFVLCSTSSASCLGVSHSCSGIKKHSSNPKDKVTVSCKERSGCEDDVIGLETDYQNEIVHILSHDDNEEELVLGDFEVKEESLECLGQNNNFLPGLGTTVIIPMDDLKNK